MYVHSINHEYRCQRRGARSSVTPKMFALTALTFCKLESLKIEDKSPCALKYIFVAELRQMYAQMVLPCFD